MANYGYGYGNYTSQPQQYSAGNFATQNAGSYGYASTQPATRVVQGYQTGATAYGTTGYAPQTPVQAVPVSSGGYGYFQRASDQGNAYNQKTSSFNSSQGYGYGTQKAAAYTGSSGYQKPQSSFNATSSSYNSGYSTGQRSATAPNYGNNQSYSKQKNNTSTTKSSSGTHQNAYEKVVYNAATSFLTQQAQTSKPTWQKSEKPTFKLHNQQRGNNWQAKNSSAGSKPQQLHYCEVCKISCAGPQTYKEHLEGQKHKKKAASSTTDTKSLPPGSYKCELCDVICTGRDAFSAHVNGTNHTKTLKLHQKLGKPIPEIKIPEEPKKANVVKTIPLKMNFVGGTKLTSTGEEKQDIKTGNENEAVEENEVPVEGEPVGEEYVEDVKSDAGKVIGYKCTICDCRFNDNVAKVAHIKGRRHRLSYKKKVDPKFKVEVKARSGSSRSTRLGSGDNREMVWKQRQHEQMRWEQELRHREEELRRWEHDEYMRRANDDRYWTRPDRNRMHELEYYEWERRENYSEPQQLGMFPQGPPPPTADDKLIMAKHTDIYPLEEELKQVQNTVAAVEKALKLVSDEIGDKDNTSTASKADSQQVDKMKTEAQEQPVETATSQLAADSQTADTETTSATDAQKNNRILKGVMRIGPLCTGLLLKGQLAVDLVVLCADKPTVTLLTKVGKLVPEKLKEAAPDEKFNMAIRISECSLIITSTTEPKCLVKIVFTSPSVREENTSSVEGDDDKSKPAEEQVDAKDLLDKGKTLEALAALRHAKWFQARANQLTSCVITIRIMRDMCQRVPAFKPLSGWAIELLCEKSLGSSFHPLAPGESFRRVLEAISSGILLPGGAGILDPCEKDKVDAAQNMSAQEREDITAAAQHALRLLAFRQLHKVLAIEPLKPNTSRKRPATESVSPTTTTDVQDTIKVPKIEK